MIFRKYCCVEYPFKFLANKRSFLKIINLYKYCNFLLLFFLWLSKWEPIKKVHVNKKSFTELFRYLTMAKNKCNDCGPEINRVLDEYFRWKFALGRESCLQCTEVRLGYVIFVVKSVKDNFFVILTWIFTLLIQVCVILSLTPMTEGVNFIAQSICTNYFCFENQGRFMTLKKIGHPAF